MAIAEGGAGPARDVVLEVSGLSVAYRGTRPVIAVNEVGFRLDRGEVLGIAGESGSGKSTMAHAITRLLSPPGAVVAGTVRFTSRSGQTQDILSLSDSELRRLRWSEVAIMFQAAMNALNPVLTVRSQVLDVLKAHQAGLRADEQARRVDTLLELVGIPLDRARAFPHELSGGMRQRAVLAIVLALDPALIVLDEPTTALDVVVQRQVIARILELREKAGYAVIFITHDLSLLVEVADRIVIMYAGRVVEEAPAESLYSRPAHPYSAGLLGSFPVLRGPRRVLTGISGEPPNLASLPPGCSFHPRCRYARERCRFEAPVLLGRAEVGGDEDGRVACWLQVESPGTSTLLVSPYAEPPGADRSAAEGQVEVLRVSTLGKEFRVRKKRTAGRRTPAVRSLHAVEGVSFSLFAGAVTALVGESGSGKSTVGRMVARLLKPSEGNVKLLSAPSGLGRRAYARRVQMVLQDPFSSLNPTHRVGYHIVRAVRIHQSLRSRREVREEACRLLSDVGLTPEQDYLDAFPHELSGGQRQRVAIARALAARPGVLVTDEPVSMLDVSIRLGVLNLLADLSRSQHFGLLYITHDIASARYFASETLVMYAGELIEGGPSEEVTQEPAHPYTQLLISCAPDPERRRGFVDVELGEVPSLISPPSGCRFHPRCPHAKPICVEEAPGRTDLGPGRWVRCWLFAQPGLGETRPDARA